MEFVISKHALEQMDLRGISKDIVTKILNAPDQIREEEGKKVYQSLVENGKYLIRIFVNSNKRPLFIVTVYKTSKISKYYEGKV